MANDDRKINFDETLAAIEGMRYSLDGISGLIRVTRIGGITRIEHHPDAAGKRTESYKQKRREYGDDWFTSDFTDGDSGLAFWAAVEKNGLVRYQ